MIAFWIPGRPASAACAAAGAAVGDALTTAPGDEFGAAVGATACGGASTTNAAGGWTGAVNDRAAARSATCSFCTDAESGVSDAGSSAEVGIAITPAVKAAMPAATYERAETFISRLPRCAIHLQRR